jgi:hypothetical protein
MLLPQLQLGLTGWVETVLDDDSGVVIGVSALVHQDEEHPLEQDRQLHLLQGQTAMDVLVTIFEPANGGGGGKICCDRPRSRHPDHPLQHPGGHPLQHHYMLQRHTWLRLVVVALQQERQLTATSADSLLLLLFGEKRLSSSQIVVRVRRVGPVVGSRHHQYIDVESASGSLVELVLLAHASLVSLPVCRTTEDTVFLLDGARVLPGGTLRRFTTSVDANSTPPPPPGAIYAATMVHPRDDGTPIFKFTTRALRTQDDDHAGGTTSAGSWSLQPWASLYELGLSNGAIGAADLSDWSLTLRAMVVPSTTPTTQTLITSMVTSSSAHASWNLISDARCEIASRQEVDPTLARNLQPYMFLDPDSGLAHVGFAAASMPGPGLPGFTFGKALDVSSVVRGTWYVHPPSPIDPPDAASRLLPSNAAAIAGAVRSDTWRCRCPELSDARLLAVDTELGECVVRWLGEAPALSSVFVEGVFRDDCVSVDLRHVLASLLALTQDLATRLARLE